MARPLILVVDDEFLVRINIAESLEEAGFHVIEACDAASALEILDKEPGVELVCTDVHMPGELDGVDLAMRVREHLRHIKVMFVSGGGNRRALPPDIPFLAKPFLSGRLVELARNQLASTRPAP